MDNEIDILLCDECGVKLKIIFIYETDKYGIKTGYKIIDYIACPKCLKNIVVDINFLRHK